MVEVLQVLHLKGGILSGEQGTGWSSLLLVAYAEITAQAWKAAAGYKISEAVRRNFRLLGMSRLYQHSSVRIL